MPTNTNVTNLKINELTEAQYDAAVQGGTIGANELSVITDLDDAIQVSSLPTAAVGELDKIYQFIGTTDANYTNGYFYKCVSDGQDPATYSWTRTDVQPSVDPLPSQSGNNGKFLTTNGTSASWANVDTLPTQTGQSGKFLTTDGTDASWSDKPLVNTARRTGALAILGNTNGDYSTVVGNSAASYGTGGVAIGASSNVGNSSVSAVAVGREATASDRLATAIGGGAKATAEAAIQLGDGTNSTGATFNVGFYYRNVRYNYRLLNTDGTIPTDRLPNAINKYSTMPTAAAANVGWIVQFTGATDSTYTHGYIYECKAQGTNPETYAWEAVEVQAGGSGGSMALSLTLAAANWSNNSITVTATGVTATNNVIVSPAPVSQSAYTTAGVMCTAQASDSLTFTCTTTPSSDLTVTVLII